MTVYFIICLMAPFLMTEGHYHWYNTDFFIKLPPPHRPYLHTDYSHSTLQYNLETSMLKNVRLLKITSILSELTAIFT